MAMNKTIKHGSQESFNLGYQAHETQCLDNKICPMHHTMHPIDKNGMFLHELSLTPFFTP